MLFGTATTGSDSRRVGVALLMVLSSILLMTVLVSEIAYSATVRLSLAAHHRDEGKAEALAFSGMQFIAWC